jgi:hypothetical protein
VSGVEAPTTAGSLVYANQRAELLQVSSALFYNRKPVIFRQHEQQQQGLIQSRRTSHAIANGRYRKQHIPPLPPSDTHKSNLFQTLNPNHQLQKRNDEPHVPIIKPLQQRHIWAQWERRGRAAEDVADQEKVGPDA